MEDTMKRGDPVLPQTLEQPPHDNNNNQSLENNLLMSNTQQNLVEDSFQEIPSNTEQNSLFSDESASSHLLYENMPLIEIHRVVEDLKPKLPVDQWKTQLIKFEKNNSSFLLLSEASLEVPLHIWPHPTLQEVHLLPELAVRIIIACNHTNLEDGNYALLKIVFALTQVSHNFNMFANSNFLWLVLCQESFPGFVMIRNCIGLQYNYKHCYEYFRSMHLQPQSAMKLFYETSLSSYALMNIKQFVLKNQLSSVTFAISRITNLLGKFHISNETSFEDLNYLQKIPELLSILCENISLHFRESFLPHPDKMSPSDLFLEVAQCWSLLQHFVRVVSLAFLPLFHLYGTKHLSQIIFPNLKKISYNGFKEDIFSKVQGICLAAIESGTIPITRALAIRPMFDYFRVKSGLPESEEPPQYRPALYVLLSPQDSNRTIRCEIELLKDVEGLKEQLDLLVCGEEDVDDTAPIPLPVPVTLKILLRVIEFAKMRRDQHVIQNSGMEEDGIDPIKIWLEGFDQALLFEVILAANSIYYKPLLDATCKCVANMIKGKTPEEIRKTFNIKNDFTPEEEEQVRRENEWCEER